jgi:hypothetical protein
MQNLKIEYINEIDLSFLDNDFFVAMLNQIMLTKTSCGNNFATLMCACLDTSIKSFALGA